MRPATYEKLRLTASTGGGYTSTGDLLQSGLTNRQIASLVQEGRLEKIAHGRYWIPDGRAVKPWDYKAIEAACVNPAAVICAASACYYQGLIDVEPPALFIATRRDDRHKMALPFSVSRHYYAVASFTEDLTLRETPCGSYQIYDLDRSVCDCIRFRRQLDEDLFGLILERYRKKGDRNLGRLYAYARAVRAEGMVKSARVE